MTPQSRRLTGLVALAITVVAASASAYIFVVGGFSLSFAGGVVSSHDPWRPAVIALVALAVVARTGGVSLFRGGWSPRISDAAVAGLLAVAVTGTGIAYSTTTAGGSDAYGYVSQAELWMHGLPKVAQPWTRDVPWPGGFMTFSTLGYRANEDKTVLVPTYASGLPLLMAVAKRVGGQEAMFWVVPISGGLLVLTTYGIGCRLGSPRAGLIGAWLVATSPPFLFMLVAPMTDVPVAAAWALALYALFGESKQSCAWSGVATGMALLIRPNLAPLAVIPLGWFLFDVLRTARLRVDATAGQARLRVDATAGQARLRVDATAGQARLRVDATAGQARLRVDATAGQARLRVDATAGQARLRADATAGQAGPAKRDRWLRLAAYVCGLAPMLAALAYINTQLYGAPLRSGYGSAATFFAVDHVLPNLKRYPLWFAQYHTPLAFAGVAALLLPFTWLWTSARDRLFVVVATLFAGALFSEYCLFMVFDAWWYQRFLLSCLPFIMVGVGVVAVWLTRSRGLLVRVVTAAAVVIMGARGVRLAASESTFELWQGERRYTTVARLVRSITDPNSVVISAQHSGSLRYYGGRMTMRFDWMEDGWLDRTVAWLSAHGAHPYLLIEDWELPAIAERFKGQRTLNVLSAPAVFEYLGGARVLFFDLLKARDREAHPDVYNESYTGNRSVPPVAPPVFSFKSPAGD